MIKRHKEYNPRAIMVLTSFTAAYVALICGLKLDGFTNLPWTLLLSPVWFPIASILVFAAFWVVIIFIILATDYLVRKLRGGL